MATTITLVYAGHNRLRYLVVSDDASAPASIPSVGGPSPDLITDSLAGPIKEIASVKTKGYGVIPVGGITTQAQARALLLSDLGAGPPIAFGQEMVTCTSRLTMRSGGARAFLVDAVRGPVDLATPGITITPLSGSAASAYLDIEVGGAIGA